MAAASVTQPQPGSILLIALASAVAAVGHAHVEVVRAERLGSPQAPEVGQSGLIVGVVLERLAVHHHRLALQVHAARRRDLWELGHGGIGVWGMGDWVSG